MSGPDSHYARGCAARTKLRTAPNRTDVQLARQTRAHATDGSAARGWYGACSSNRRNGVRPLYERRREQRAGFTLVELVVILALIGLVTALAASNLSHYAENQRAATSARAVADAFSLGRAEAIRTGSQVIVAFDIESGLDGISSDIVIARDEAGGAADCEIDAGEIIEELPLLAGVSWGTDPALANGAPAPDDAGGSGNQATGSSFQDAGSPEADASWVMFSPDGMPHLFTEDGTAPCDEVGAVGEAGGAIYLTNGKRDYAVVLSALGIPRLHRWNPENGAWTE